MYKKVYTYTRIDELNKAPYFAEIAPIPEITMSVDLASAMVFSMRIFKDNIHSASTVQRRLFPDWNTPSQKFTYFTILNHFIQGKIVNSNSKGEKDWLIGCKKNIFQAIQNIIRLVEAGIYLEDFKKTIGIEDKSLKLFIEMWEKIEAEDRSINSFRERVKRLHDVSEFDREISNIFKFIAGKKIVFNGFQYFTPIQHIIYDCFENAGYDIYALIQCEERYPYANEIWNTMYNAEKGFPDKTEWIKQPDLYDYNPIGDIFENGHSNNNGKIKLIQYDNTIDFIYDINRIKNDGYYIYCADDNTANNILKDYFPERYEARNLLSYPIGQFIYILHKMWDETHQCIALNENGLRKCFASGWLSYNGNSSARYTDDLEKILPYFSGCYTLDQWRTRLKDFRESFENAVDEFRYDGDNVATGKQRILGNPFDKFSYFSLEEDRIDAVMSIIHDLMDMARNLFGKNEPISIQAHINKLDSLLSLKDGMSNDLFLEEKKKVKLIFKALESDRIRDFLCYPADLAQAMLSFLDGSMDEDDIDKAALQTLVFNLFQIEVAPVNANGKVHICFSDINTLPGKGNKYAWPLSEEVMCALNAAIPNSYIFDILNYSNIVALSNRNYFYNALKNNDVEISWVKKRGDKVLAPSPYVTLLMSLANIPVTSNTNRDITIQEVNAINKSYKLRPNYNIDVYKENNLIDRKLDYSLCPMRYVYSFVLDTNSSFRSEYQINRAIIRLIQILHELFGNMYSLEEISKQVFELFPGIRKAEKRQILDDAANYRLSDVDTGYTELDKVKYSNLRLALTYPDSKVYSSAKNSRNTNTTGIFTNRGSGDVHLCESCPHSEYCTNSLFGIDYLVEQ